MCIGSNLESFETLKVLVSNGCRIQALITLPSGLGQGVSDYVDLHEFCAEHDIACIDTENVNAEETIERVTEFQPDYLFTLGWSQIFKTEFISCFSEFVIGTHPSKLPYGRGRAPLPWTILEGLTESAVSYFKIDTGVDTGKLIFQRTFEIPPGTYVGELYDRVATELAQGFLELYQSLDKGETITFTSQGEEGITVRGKRVPSDGLIEFNRPAREIERLVRAVSQPYPGAYCYYKDQKITFWRARMNHDLPYSGTLGQILKKKKNGVLVQCGLDSIWLEEPTDEKGKELESKFFRLGDRLGYQVQDEIYYLRQKLK